MPVSVSIVTIFAVAVLAMVAILLGGLIKDVFVKHRKEKARKKSIEQMRAHHYGVQLLNKRLEGQRRQQLEHIEARDRNDELIIDKVEEYRRDFD
jgi:hypothetical protein